MKHIKTLVKKSIRKSGNIGCGECQSSCQSACKTSCTVGNQNCKQADIKIYNNKKTTEII